MARPNNIRIKKNCQKCGNEFMGWRTKGHKYCDKVCRDIAAKEYNIERQKLSPNYICNAKYFEFIDNIEKAYWLGFAYADGFVNKTETVFRFNLSIKDDEHLNKFIYCVSGDTSTKSYYPAYKIAGPSVHYYILNSEFVKHLVDKGCSHKKSLTIRFPSLASEELESAFLAGYYDGDGSQNSATITSGSFEFLEDILVRFNLFTKIYKSTTNNTYTLSYSTALYRRTRDIVPKELLLERKNILNEKHYSETSPEALSLKREKQKEETSLSYWAKKAAGKI